MGFLSYCTGYYRRELQRLEASAPTAADICLARRLLRMSDDLANEGYTELNERIEAEFRGLARLRGYLARNGAEPFAPVGDRGAAGKLPYSARDEELGVAVARAVREAESLGATACIPFIGRLRDFCRWIGYDDKTAYVFLLRDALLPFVYYLGRGRERIYPWLISRRSFAALTGRENADDELRASVYRALESGCADFDSFLDFVLPDMRRTAAAYPQAEAAIRSMFGGIDAERVIVVESGCAGTFPLLFASLDSRVDIRMYTTYPYLADIFGGRIFTPQYEENRMLETLAAQELYFRFSGLKNGRFYVQKCTDEAVARRALCEIGLMLEK